MCIIIYSPKGNIPKRHLHNSLEHNRDGWGVMWPDDGNLNIIVGLDKQEFFKEWKKLVRVPGPKVFHARIGTHGLTNTDNCHPFRIGGDHVQLGMAHNGIIHQQCVAKSDKSDTRHFIENVIDKLPTGFQTQPVFHVLLSDYIGSCNKLVFMDGDGDVNIFNESQGDWDGGNWYSNRFYKDCCAINRGCGTKLNSSPYVNSHPYQSAMPSVPPTIAASVPFCVAASSKEADSDMINTPMGFMSVSAYKEKKARRERVCKLLRERQAKLREANFRQPTEVEAMAEAYGCDLL